MLLIVVKQKDNFKRLPAWILARGSLLIDLTGSFTQLKQLLIVSDKSICTREAEREKKKNHNTIGSLFRFYRSIILALQKVISLHQAHPQSVQALQV